MARVIFSRRALALGALAVLLMVGVGLLVAWSHGAFESRLMYWRERGQDCGSVTYLPDGSLIDRSAAERAASCFVAAYARCEPAALTRNPGGTDGGGTETFVVEPRESGKGCDVGLRYTFGISGSPRSTTEEAQCAYVTSANGALTIAGCQGFGDITIP